MVLSWIIIRRQNLPFTMSRRDIGFHREILFFLQTGRADRFRDARSFISEPDHVLPLSGRMWAQPGRTGPGKPCIREWLSEPYRNIYFCCFIFQGRRTVRSVYIESGIYSQIGRISERIQPGSHIDLCCL